MNLIITYAASTRPGGRDVNEDSVLCVERDGNYCFAVADGLGGHARGEAASQAAVEAFEKLFKGIAKDADGAAVEGARPSPAAVKPRVFIEDALNAAQNDVLEKQKKEKALADMKTTVAALAIAGKKFAYGHIGDTRIYAFKNNKVKKRTLDHSVPQILVLSGEIKEDEIRGHPDRNILLRVIGAEWDSLKYELSDEEDLSGYQAFLLCSDGFWEYIDEKRMCVLLKQSGDAGGWLDMMVAEVEKNGAGKPAPMDNYSAVAVLLQPAAVRRKPSVRE